MNFLDLSLDLEVVDWLGVKGLGVGDGKVGRGLGDVLVRVLLPHKVEELVGIFADVGLGVVAGDVVPFHSVLVDVVEQPHAGLKYTSCLRNGDVAYC